MTIVSKALFSLVPYLTDKNVLINNQKMKLKLYTMKVHVLGRLEWHRDIMEGIRKVMIKHVGDGDIKEGDRASIGNTVW
jgi:hypothetical protein